MSKLKRHHKIEITAICLLLALSVAFVSFLSVHQFSSHELRVKYFFMEEENAIDVVNIGASEIYTGFSPEYIWHNYGITSYNLATAGAPMRLAKSEVKAAMETQNPKLMVISLNGAMYDDERSTHEGYTRMWLDNMPYSQLREEAIEEWIPEKDRINFRWKILNYHDNVARLTECLQLSWKEFKAKKDQRFLTISGVQGNASTDKKRDIVDISNYNKERKLDKEADKDLTDLLEYLKGEDIKNVIFVNMPRFYDKEMLGSKEKINTAIKKVKSYGYDVYDFDKLVGSIGLDQQHDFYNAAHPNIYGQQKISKYFYENIVPKYVKNHREYSDELVERWNENYDVYTQFYAWADKVIKEKGNRGYYYTYKAIDHIMDGTIDKYEKWLDMKSKIVKKSGEDTEDRESTGSSHDSGSHPDFDLKSGAKPDAKSEGRSR